MDFHEEFLSKYGFERSVDRMVCSIAMEDGGNVRIVVDAMLGDISMDVLKETEDVRMFLSDKFSTESLRNLRNMLEHGSLDVRIEVVKIMLAFMYAFGSLIEGIEILWESEYTKGESKVRILASYNLTNYGEFLRELVGEEGSLEA